MLDFGCGAGDMLPVLERFGEVRAVDGDAEAVEVCRERGHDGVMHVPPGTALPFDDQSFDLVTSLDVIEHAADDVGALRELHRVLRPGGHLFVTVPAFQSLWGDQDEISRHYRRYRSTDLSCALEQAGFTVRRTTYFNTFLFPPIAAVRLARRVVRPPSAERTDFDVGGRGRLGRVLARVFAAEAPLIARGRLPFGVSLLAVARR